MIVTKNKETFLQDEYDNWYCNLIDTDYIGFLDYMEADIKSCKNCGVYYWSGCKKRCTC